MLDCYIQSAEKREILLQLIEQSRIEFLFNDYHQLPKDFKIDLVDKSTINNNNREFHSFLRTNCWILIDDGAKNIFTEIYKTSIHSITWDHLMKHLERELLLVLDKCIKINKLFNSDSKNEFVQLQKIDNSYKAYKTSRIYLFTIIDKNTYIYYKSTEGSLKRMMIQNSLSLLEQKLQDHNFFRTHKNFLINVNQLNDNLDLNSETIKIGPNITAKLSKQKQDDFINYLENL